MPTKVKLEEIATHLGIKERALYNKLKYESSFSDTDVVILTSLFRCSRADLSKEFFEMSKEEIDFCKKHNIGY